jgi:hypothetical protein
MLTAYPPEQAAGWIEAAIQADPTSRHAYVAWVLGQVRDGVIRLPEDMLAVKELLTRWEQLKATDTTSGDRDINRHGYYGLRRLVERAALKESRRKQEMQIKQQGVETIYYEGRYRILQITKPAAAAAMARGTRWCTSEPEEAARYLAAGPFYLILRDGIRIALVHLRAGAMCDEQDARLIPDAELAAILENLLRPTLLGHFAGLSLILGRPLLTPRQERNLLRWWSASYEANEMNPDVPFDTVTTYLVENLKPGTPRHPWLLNMVRAELAKSRLNLVWQLNAAGILTMAELWRPLRNAVQRCLVGHNFRALNRLLSHFSGTDLTHTNLAYLEDEFIELLWKLFAPGPSAVQEVLSSERSKQGRTVRSRRRFVAFLRELRQVRYSRGLQSI